MTDSEDNLATGNPSRVQAAWRATGLRGLSLVWGAPQGSRRAEKIARNIGIELRYLDRPRRRSRLDAPIRYLAHAEQSRKLIGSLRPDVVFIQNPPVFAPLALSLLTRRLDFKLVVDSHTGAIVYPQWRWSLPLQKRISRRAAAMLITNQPLADTLTEWRRVFVLRDPPLVLPPFEAVERQERTSVGLICIGDPDEPVGEMLEAARRLPEMSFFMTGRLESRRFRSVLANKPENVRLTGFIREGYFELLHAADVIVCLTEDDFTFQSGAGEAMWLGKPLVTTDLPVLREYFFAGTIHVKNRADEIEEALREVRDNHRQLAEEMHQLRERRKAQWTENALELIRRIAQ